MENVGRGQNQSVVTVEAIKTLPIGDVTKTSCNVQVRGKSCAKAVKLAEKKEMRLNVMRNKRQRNERENTRMEKI